MHRWSFNGDLADSVGNSDAVIMVVGSSNVSLSGSEVSLSGGAKADSDYILTLGSFLGGKHTIFSTAR